MRASIHHAPFTSFEIFKHRESNIGQRAFRTITQHDGDEIVTTLEECERTLPTTAVEITQHADHRMSALHAIEFVERACEICAASNGFKRKKVSCDTEHMARTFLCRHESLNAIGEEQQSNFVVRSRRAKCQRSCNFCGELTLQFSFRAKRERRTEIHRKNHREFTLLPKDLHVRFADARGDIPVDASDIVANEVWPHLFELHASSSERTPILTSERFAHAAARPDLQSSNVLERFRREHGASSRVRAGENKLRNWHMLKQNAHQVIAGLFFRFRFVTENEPMAQHKWRDVFHILWKHEAAAVEECPSARGLCE